MLTPAIRVPIDVVPADDALRAAFAAIRTELELPGAYPEDAVREALDAAAHVPLPDRDETAVEFLTIDPAGSMDLDQAMHLERDGQGYRVRYAIADVPAFVRPGGALDAETRRRAETVYLPDARIPLHPEQLSEGAASLLEGQVRPAFVWDIRLDAEGATTAAEVYRARVRSHARLDYDGVQAMIDAGEGPPTLALLAEIGRLRITQEQLRGGASLPMPQQEVTRTDDGAYRLSLRPPVPAEDWNAQISLLTGMAAAELMLHARVGILRTMPAPDPGAVARFRRQATALGVPWPAEQAYGDFIRSLDRDDPRHLALINDATALFRGAGYTPFDGELPADPEQAAVAAPYAHVTAPLRRLVDRFGLVICEAVCAGTPVPDWVREALPTLPDLMRAGDQLAARAERMSTDAVEAAVLTPLVGQTFAAYVVDEAGDKGVVVQLVDHAVTAKASGHAEPGTRVQVTLAAADVATRSVGFEIA